MKLQFYTIDTEYLEQLQKIEKKVPLKQENRPFLGIAFYVQNKYYFLPLSSPKPKHKIMQERDDFIKIQNGILGVINLNNMIPVPISRCKKILLETITDTSYRSMLKKQAIWCNANSEKIITQARELYDRVCYLPNNETLKKRCCNFKKMEKACREYMKKNYLQEEEFIYQIT